MNGLCSAKLILVWFGLVWCLLSEPSVYLAILQIFSNYGKKIISYGFFIGNTILLFFFHPTEIVCSGAVYILNPRGPGFGATSALPWDHAACQAQTPHPNPTAPQQSIPQPQTLDPVKRLPCSQGLTY